MITFFFLRAKFAVWEKLFPICLCYAREIDLYKVCAKWMRIWWRAVNFWHLIHEYKWGCFKFPRWTKWSIFTLHVNQINLKLFKCWSKFKVQMNQLWVKVQSCSHSSCFQKSHFSHFMKVFLQRINSFSSVNCNILLMIYADEEFVKDFIVIILWIFGWLIEWGWSLDYWLAYLHSLVLDSISSSLVIFCSVEHL